MEVIVEYITGFRDYVSFDKHTISKEQLELYNSFPHCYITFSDTEYSATKIHSTRILKIHYIDDIKSSEKYLKWLEEKFETIDKDTLEKHRDNVDNVIEFIRSEVE